MIYTIKGFNVMPCLKDKIASVVKYRRISQRISFNRHWVFDLCLAKSQC